MRWPDLPLGEAGKWRSGGTPSTTNPDYWGGDIPWISSGSLIGTRLSDSERRLTPEGAANGTSLVDEGAILFVVRGMSLKSEFRVGRSMRRLAFGQDCKAIVVDRAKFQPEFLTYALKALEPIILGMVDEAGHGTGRLDTGLMEGLEVPMPDLATQTAIADVLGALDDKIAANEQVVTALDSLVRAMVEGGMQGETVRVGDVASLVSLKSNGGGPVVPYLGLEHLPRRRLWAQDSGLSSEVTSQKSVFEEGDLLFGKLRPYFHKVVVAQHAGVCSTDILVVRAIDEELRGWMWAALASDDVVAAVSATSTGTRMPRASWGDLAEVQVPWPGRSEAARVSRQIESLNARAGAAVAESRRLAATRDALLPELMSGRLNVGEVA